MNHPSLNVIIIVTFSFVNALETLFHPPAFPFLMIGYITGRSKPTFTKQEGAQALSKNDRIGFEVVKIKRKPVERAVKTASS
jgi:hypothetical protein